MRWTGDRDTLLLSLSSSKRPADAEGLPASSDGADDAPSVRVCGCLGSSMALDVGEDGSPLPPIQPSNILLRRAVAVGP